MVTPQRIPRTVPPPPRSTMRCQSWPTTTQGQQNAVQQSGPPPGGSQQPHALPPSQRPAGAGAAGWTTVVAVVTTMVGGGAPAITTGIFPGCWTACAVGAGCSMPTTVPERTTGSCWTTVPVATGWLPSAWYTGWLPSAEYCSPCIVARCLRSKTDEYGR